MENNQPLWVEWAQFLHRRRLARLTSIVLDSIGPLNLLAAQLVYIGLPFWQSGVSKGNLEHLANMLEDPQKTRSFVQLLREEKPK